MRVIIIEEDRFSEVLEAMKSRATELRENSYLMQHTKLSKEDMQFAADEIFRSINYEFVRWAQSHGASCVRH
jgi:hypothetical protein